MNASRSPLFHASADRSSIAVTEASSPVSSPSFTSKVQAIVVITHVSGNRLTAERRIKVRMFAP